MSGAAHTSQPDEQPRPPRPPATEEPQSEHAQADEQPVRLEQREVRADDPHLSPETNARLTEELREIVGSDTVEVPADRERIAEGDYPVEEAQVGYLNGHRVFFVIRWGLIALTFGGILALVTNIWWLLPLAAGIHALGTVAVTMTTVRLTTISEHPSPTLAAALTEEGVSSADEHFTRMVDEFRPIQSGDAQDVLSPTDPQRTTSASQDPALAGAEQSSALTPTAEPSEPGPVGGVPAYMIWTVLIGLFLVSFIIPPLSNDADMWLLPVVSVPLLLAFGWLEVTMSRHPERLQMRSIKPLLGIGAMVIISVAAFCAAVAIGMKS